MGDLEQQLAELRARVARAAADCDRRFAYTPDEPQNVSHWLPGDEVETAFGRHLETGHAVCSASLPRQRGYRRVERSAARSSRRALRRIDSPMRRRRSGRSWTPRPRDWRAARAPAPSWWAWAASPRKASACASSSCAITARRPASWTLLARHLEPFRVLITYNGRTFDQPLLETRYRMHRARPPFARMEHLDLLYGARRLWKLRFESCRLVDLENQVLGVEREGDIPGALIPYVYFEYLRTRQAARLLPVFEHNAHRHSHAGLPHRHRAQGVSATPRGSAAPWQRNGRHGPMAARGRRSGRARALLLAQMRSTRGPAGRSPVPRHVGPGATGAQAGKRSRRAGVVGGSGRGEESVSRPRHRGTGQASRASRQGSRRCSRVDAQGSRAGGFRGTRAPGSPPGAPHPTDRAHAGGRRTRSPRANRLSTAPARALL